MKDDRFDAHLQNVQLRPATKEKYTWILDNIPRQDVVKWLHQLAGDPNTPLGTLLVTRTCVKHYLVGVLGYDPEDVEGMLPPARTAKGSKMRQPLTRAQLDLYHTLVEEVANPTVRTIMRLIPRTGMRIGELCSRRVYDFWDHEDAHFFRYDSPLGKERIVPLGPKSWGIIRQYMQEARPIDYLFPGRNESEPIQPQTVRVHMRRLAKSNPGVGDLSPDVLRITAATLWLSEGESLENIRMILGHQFSKTTRRLAKYKQPG